MKASLDGGATKELVLEHGEKAVFTAGVLCFLLFAYSLLGRESLPPDKQPNKLLEAAGEAKNSMELQRWDPVREGVAVANYMSRARRLEVLSTNYALRAPLDRPLKLPKGKRGDPELFAAMDLRAASGMGAFALTKEKAAPAPPPAAEPAANQGGNQQKKPHPPGPAEPRGGRPKGSRPIDVDLPYDVGVKGIPGDATLAHRQWAVVTALVPCQKQAGEFERAFREANPVAVENGRGPGKAEVEEGRDVPVYAGVRVERAAIVAGAPVEPQWTPIALQGYYKTRYQWAVVAKEVVSEDYTDPVYTMPLGPLVASEWDDAVGHEPEIPLAVQEEFEKHQQAAIAPAPAEAKQVPAGVLGFGPPPAEDAAKAPPLPNARAKNIARKLVEYRLLRIFDFDVELGKTYQYRVRLVLKNPNFGIPEKFLENVGSKKAQFRETPWSAASPPARIQSVDALMFAGVHPAHGIRGTTIGIKLVTLDPEMGVPAVVEEEVVRGAVMNYRKNVEVADLIRREWIKHRVEFKSEALLLDIRGGRSLSQRDKSLTEPGEALFFRRNGELVAHNELDDLKRWEYYPNPEKKAETGGKPPKKEKNPEAAL